MPKTSKKNTKTAPLAHAPAPLADLVAEICLYGTHATGAGWIAAAHRDGVRHLLGDGAIHRGRAFTEAVWMACGALEAVGVKCGTVAIFAPGGERVAYATLGYVPCFGDLPWDVAPAVKISAAQVEGAAVQP
jgi:hypothetical protein